jgi:hypothetical protein
MAESINTQSVDSEVPGSNPGQIYGLRGKAQPSAKRRQTAAKLRISS